MEDQRRFDQRSTVLRVWPRSNDPRTAAGQIQLMGAEVAQEKHEVKLYLPPYETYQTRAAVVDFVVVVHCTWSERMFLETRSQRENPIMILISDLYLCVQRTRTEVTGFVTVICVQNTPEHDTVERNFWPSWVDRSWNHLTWTVALWIDHVFALGAWRTFSLIGIMDRKSRISVYILFIYRDRVLYRSSNPHDTCSSSSLTVGLQLLLQLLVENGNMFYHRRDLKLSRLCLRHKVLVNVRFQLWGPGDPLAICSNTSIAC